MEGRDMPIGFRNKLCDCLKQLKASTLGLIAPWHCAITLSTPIITNKRLVSTHCEAKKLLN